MCRRSVVNVLRTMEARGWLVRERVIGETGGLAANRYALTIWDAHWAVEADSAGNALVQEMHHPSAGDAPPLVHHVPYPSAPRAHKEEQLKKNKIRNLDKTPFCSPVEPKSRRPSVSDTPPDHVEKAPSPQPVENPVENPIMPTFLISDPSFLEPQVPQTPPESPLSVQKQPQQPISPWGQPRPLEGPSEAPVKKQAPKAKSAVFCPNNDDVPAALLPVSEKIIAFWQHKAGKKTPQAWSLLIQELTKINDFVNGGLDAVSEQCDLGIKARINGKGWMSITLNNFIKMGGGSSKPRQRYGRQDVLEKAHEASQIVKKLKERQAREEAEFFAMMDCTSLSQGAV